MVAKKSQAHPANADEKFRELILYLAKNSQDDKTFGGTKLNKLLFFCDFLAYRSLGRSITGQEYQRLDFGPAPRRLKPICSQMVEERICDWEERTYFGKQQKRLVALRDPRPDVFTESEISLITDVLDELRNSNASEVSELSHTFLGWQLAAKGETIPYATILISAPRPLNEEEQTWANQAIEEYLESHQANAQV